MRIFVTGSIAYDYIMVFPGRFRDHILADKMHVLSVSFLVDSLKRRRGGTAANIAYNLALLGEQPVVVGTVGEDFAEYRQWLDSTGVDTSGIKVIADEHTASCFINTDLQDSQITAFYPGAMAQASSISLHDLSAAPDDLVIIAPNDPKAMARYTAECTAAGIPYLYDPVDAASADGTGRARDRVQGGQDPGGQRLRVWHDGREDGTDRARTAAASARDGDDPRRGRRPDHGRRQGIRDPPGHGPRRSSIPPAQATPSARVSSWG